MPTLDPNLLKEGLLPAHPLLPSSFALQAAVLLLICKAENDPITFLTLRSDEHPAHPGQISLPGGRIANIDNSFEATALREAQEETAIDPAQVSILGRLPTTRVSTGYQITPVVGWTNTLPQLKADPREVAQIITCPLSHLSNPDAYHREHLIKAGVKREFWVIEYEQHRIWGATAAILYSLATHLQTKKR